MNDIILISIPETAIKNIVEQAVRKALGEYLPPTKPDHNDENFLTREDAAKLLGVGLCTLDKMAKQGHLKKYRSGSIVRLKKSEVLEVFKTFEKRKRHQFENLKT